MTWPDLSVLWGGRMLVDWDDDGRYAHPASDVTDYLRGLKYLWGCAERSNPDRPVPKFGSGSATLIGERFIEGLSSVLSTDQIVSRHDFTITLPNSARPIRGRIRKDFGRAQSRRGSMFTMEGLRSEDQTEELTETQPTMDVTSDQQSFLDWAAARCNVAALIVRAAITTFGVFTFTGRRGKFVSQLAQALAALPCPDRSGGLRLHDPSMAPARVERVDGSVYAVEAASARVDINHLRNSARVVYANVGANARTAAGSTTRGGSGLRGSHDSIVLPSVTLMVPNSGGVLSDVSVDVTYAVRVPLHFTYAGMGTPSSWQWIDVPADFNNSNEPDPIASINGHEVTVSQTLPSTWPGGAPFTAAPGRNLWNVPPFQYTSQGQDDPITVSGVAMWRSFNNYIWCPEVRASYVISVTETVTVESVLTAADAASRQRWGHRPLAFPPWLRPTDNSRLNAIVASLSEPRQLHTLTYAMPQATDAQTAAVADTEPGDWRHIVVRDRRLPTAVNSISMVMNCELRIDRRQRATVRHLYIDSGGGAYSDAYSEGYS